MRTRLLSWLAAFGLVIGLTQPAGAAVVYELDETWSGDIATGVPTATFDETVGTGDEVQLTLVSTSFAQEFTTEWYFNTDASDLTATFVSSF